MSAIDKDYRHLQKVDRRDVHLLWYFDFWDGPINGLCLCHNEKCWFEACLEGEHAFSDSNPRRFFIRRLSREQLADEEKWHDLFRENVGTHSDFDEPHPQVKPADGHQEFYEKYATRGRFDYSNNPTIGWFELS